MKDFTAGHITQPEADRIMADLNAALGADGCEFHPSVSYRNLLLLADAAAMELRCQPPHDIPDQPVEGFWPRGRGAERVMDLMQRAARLLADHPVARARRAEGRNAPTHIWLWGQGRPTALDSFASRFGVRGALITGVDILRGLAVGMGMDLVHVPGATGYIDTDFEGKGDAAVRALDDHDLVVVHVEAADEAGHLGDAAEKVKALERIDAAIVGPLLEALRAHGAYRVFGAADHPTPVGSRTHDGTPPPFCYAGAGIGSNGGTRYTEAEARRTGRLVLVDVGADWCPPCIAMKHDVWSDPEVGRRVAASYVPLLVDADRDDVVSPRYGVSGIPTVLILDASGNVIRRASYLPRSGMLRFLAGD
jgi:2,3-bisphosphoglycerate-independent phosphoglycerate mutase